MNLDIKNMKMFDRLIEDLTRVNDDKLHKTYETCVRKMTSSIGLGYRVTRQLILDEFLKRYVK